MPADVASTLAAWSSSDTNNQPQGSTSVSTFLDDNLRAIQAVVVRGLSHKGADIASAATTDLGAIEGLFHDITGVTTISSFGTVRAGILKLIKFEGALTLTHNATSLILPGAANITTANGDTAVVISEGSGNWRCLSYMPTDGGPFGPFIDSDPVVVGSADATKKVRFEVDGLTTATTRVVTVSDKSFTIGKNPTVTSAVAGSSGTYTTPSGATRLFIRLWGAGGGGAGGGNGASNGGAGGATTFSTLSAGGGAGGVVAAGGGGAGGSGSGGDINISGQTGGVYTTLTGAYYQGGNGGGSFGGSGGLGSLGAGASGSIPGGGGAGGGISNLSAVTTGSGGGGGAYLEKIITAPAASYSFSVGSGGSAGAQGGGDNAFNGAAGAGGFMVVFEFYD